MNSYLTDANVVLALLVKSHVHHDLARPWYRGLDDKDFGLCRLVQLTVLRLLATRRVMGEETMPVSAGWRVLAELSEDSRVVFVAEDLETDRQLPAMWRYQQPTPQLVNDGYLAALALSSGRRLATFDKGFREFPDLAVTIL